jgi:hypothetical protein
MSYLVCGQRGRTFDYVESWVSLMSQRWAGKLARSAPGGQQLTAGVPNLWTIVDGLTDGTGYTFTVTANTAGGQASSAATSAPVTPAPLPQPHPVLHGQPQQVGYDQYSMSIGGQRVYITAGEFDPWRTPSPSLWLDDLQKMKADGYNAVTVYFDWDYSFPRPASTTSPASGT